jgi:Txe/YoeB family toxin of Txe-Axe toxin-antitoxin module
MATVEINPHEPSQGYEKLSGSKKPERYSRRINDFHRVIYTVRPNIEGLKDPDGKLYEGIVRVISMWAHEYKAKS